jgi:hypothetical protein
MLEHSATRHWSAEDVYRALLESGDDVGLATVYRVLTQFGSRAWSHGTTLRPAIGVRAQSGRAP